MQDENRDQVLPDKSWVFDHEVTDAFDDMLARSIPQYGIMRELVTALAKKYQQNGTDIVDLGCSRGGAIAELVDVFGAQNRFIGVDVSDPMLAAARERFAGLIRTNVVSIQNVDLRYDFPASKPSVVLCVLTLQFTPIEYRLAILHRIHEHLSYAGALIIVEKVIGASAEIDAIMVEHYLDMKRKNGYSEEQIERKRLSLEGVLVPLPASINEDLMVRTGFRQIDCFWRWLNFAGWVAVK